MKIYFGVKMPDIEHHLTELNTTSSTHSGQHKEERFIEERTVGEMILWTQGYKIS